MDRASLLKFARYAFYMVLGGGLLYVLIPMEPLVFQPHIVKVVLQQLTILLIVALFLERVLEVYKLFYLSPEKERLVAQMEHLQLQYNTENQGAQPAQGELFAAQENLRNYRNYMRQTLLQRAIIFGGLMSLVGVRSLEGTFNFSIPVSVAESFRLYLFRGLDLILTAGLLAGGSEGIHATFKKLANIFPDMPQKVIEFVQAFKQNPA